MTKAALVVLVAAPVELAALHTHMKKYQPLRADQVASSKMVAGLEGVAALAWLDGVEDLEQAVQYVNVLADLVVSLRWKYHRKIQALAIEDRQGVVQSDLFSFDIGEVDL